MDVIDETNRWKDEAHFRREGSAEGLDLLGDLVLAVLALHEGKKGIADLDPQFIEPKSLLYGGIRSFLLGGDLLDRLLCCGVDPGLLFLPVKAPGHVAGDPGKAKEGKGRHARQDRDDDHDEGRHAQRLRGTGQLFCQGLVGCARHARLGNQKARGGGDDQRRDLGHEAVTDRQKGIGLRGVIECHAVLSDANDDAPDHVDERDQDPGNGIATHEFRGAIHGPEEGAFIFQCLAAGLGLILVDQAGGEIGVDRHLLAGHRVKAEPRRHFGDAARTLGDDDEVHDDQDDEDNHPDHEIPGHHEVPEGFDDMACCALPGMSILEDQPGRGEVQRQTKHRRDQQHGREGREFEWLGNKEGGHQDQDGQDDREGQQQIENHRRQGHDENDEDGQDAHRESDVTPFQESAKLLRRHEFWRLKARNASFAAKARVTHSPAPMRCCVPNPFDGPINWAIFAGFMVNTRLLLSGKS